MEKVKVLVVEDEILIADHLSEHLEDLGYEVPEVAMNYREAIELIESEHPDIAILDISLAGRKTGIDLGETIRRKYQFPFIFLTSHSDPATIDLAKKAEPSAFLTKPYTVEDLYASIEVALFNFARKREQMLDRENLVLADSLFVKQNKGFQRVDFTSIAYLASDHVYIDIFTVEGKKVTVRGTIRDLLEKLNEDFIQCHRGYIVNVKLVEAIDYLNITVAGQQIPLGKTFRDEILGRLNLV